MIGVGVQYTALYCPQEYPTKRTNRTVKTMIAQLTKGDQSSWDKLLQEIALAINASVSDSTGYSPAILTQGREPRLPTMLYDEVTPGSVGLCLRACETGETRQLTTSRIIPATRATATNVTSLEIKRGVAVRRGHGISHCKKTTSSRGPGEILEAVTRGTSSPTNALPSYIRAIVRSKTKSAAGKDMSR